MTAIETSVGALRGEALGTDGDTYTECAVATCAKRAVSRGWCNPHYQRWVRHGDPAVGRPGQTVRFWARVERTDTCWIWIGGRHGQGYGSDGGRLAHRVAYEMIVVNPDHLEPVTARENILRSNAPSAVTVRTGTCRRGHAMTADNVYVAPRTGGRRCRTCERNRSRGRA